VKGKPVAAYPAVSPVPASVPANALEKGLELFLIPFDLNSITVVSLDNSKFV
jgi:hypothetical protein